MGLLFVSSTLTKTLTTHNFLVVKNYLFLLLLIAAAGFYPEKAHGQQSIKILAGDTFNGAMNGVILGGATMALQNSTDLAPTRVGLGAGTLFGLSVGFYDISQVSRGQQFYISGTFNDGTNSSILILLDTIYGAAGGALIASSISLIVQEPLKNALKYGTAMGAWAGFGYGFFDAFVTADGPDYSQQFSYNYQNVSGLISYNHSEKITLGMLNPKLISQKKITRENITGSYTPTLELVKVNIQL
jgi:hypothetical protein